jgi:hypothetical protein
MPERARQIVTCFQYQPDLYRVQIIIRYDLPQVPF